MATTTNYGWTTPDDTGLVKDGASAIRSLGTAIDTTTKNLNPSTTLGDLEYRSSTSNTNTRIPIGTSGQGLQVVAGVPAWAASSTSTLTTTGDLLYASAANTLARRAIGSTGDVLTVSGGVPTWAAASSVPPLVNMITAGAYLTTSLNGIVTNVNPSNNITYYYPIFLNGATFDRISCQTGGSHTGTSTVRMGLYNHNSTTGKPTTVLLDAGTVSCNAASTTFEITISQSPAAGIYWLAINHQAATGSGRFTSVAGANTNSMLNQAKQSFVNPVSYQGWSQSGVTGAFATAGTLSANGSDTPLVCLRMA